MKANGIDLGTFARRTAALAVALAWALAWPLAAQERGAASATLGSTQVSLQTDGDHGRLTLTVTGPEGAVLRREVDGGSTISFEIFDRAGNRLPDGDYNWELTAAPRLSAAARERLAQARAAGDDALATAILGGAEGWVEFGSVRVQGGVLVTEGGAEAESAAEAARGLATRAGAPQLATRDQVIPDDLIVQGSACVGFDCVNNESFGFDTIRLKENNLRIKFEDTSAGAFPTNDWQLTANDSASGGLSFFSIDDITGAKVPFKIEAGAPTNNVYVDSTGKVGFQTSTPVLDLHVATGNTPAIRLEQNNTGGFTAQTWDIGANEANFFVRDVTSGSLLPFRIRPGAATSSLDIAASGNVGFGTQSPDDRLDAEGSSAINARLTTASASDNSGVVFQRAQGTAGTPTAVTTNNLLGAVQFRGYNGEAYSATVAGIDARAEEGFTTTANGTRLVFQTTATGATSPSIRMVIKNDGSVGIGTNSPTSGSKLEVSGGSIRVTGGSFIDDGTTLTVPDYVFEPDYELMSIAELGAFVAAHKHLPNVPSQHEIKQGGLNVSQFQMRLLEKVEELTLYALDQHQTIEQLRAEVRELQQALPTER